MLNAYGLDDKALENKFIICSQCDDDCSTDEYREYFNIENLKSNYINLIDLSLKNILKSLSSIRDKLLDHIRSKILNELLESNVICCCSLDIKYNSPTCYDEHAYCLDQSEYLRGYMDLCIEIKNPFHDESFCLLIDCHATSNYKQSKNLIKKLNKKIKSYKKELDNILSGLSRRTVRERKEVVREMVIAQITNCHKQYYNKFRKEIVETSKYLLEHLDNKKYNTCERTKILLRSNNDIRNCCNCFDESKLFCIIFPKERGKLSNTLLFYLSFLYFDNKHNIEKITSIIVDRATRALY